MAHLVFNAEPCRCYPRTKSHLVAIILSSSSNQERAARYQQPLIISYRSSCSSYYLLCCRSGITPPTTCDSSDKGMPTLIITVDLECCRCSTKIQKILCCIQERGEFVIEKVVYEKDKVLVSGPFDANKLSCKLCCKAGKIIKNIEVAPPPKEKEKEPKIDPPKKDPVQCKVIYPCPYGPYPCPQPAWPCSCPTPHCGCHSKPPPPPPKEEKPPEAKPKPKPDPAPWKVMYPYPYPYPWPCGCPTPYCECPYKPAPAAPPAEQPKPKPPPEQPKPPACRCPAWSQCYCGGGYPPYMPPSMPYGYPMVVCDDSPAYSACTVM